MLSRFHLILERNGQTDGPTDRFAISISRVSMVTRDKNWTAMNTTFWDNLIKRSSIKIKIHR